MIDRCRQVMASIDVQAMVETCRGMMGQTAGQMGDTVSDMMPGMCMIGR